MKVVLDAMALESKGNIKAQFAQTVSKNSVLKFSNDVYTTIQALKCYNLIKNDLSPVNITKVVETMKSDITLKRLGFKFTANGDHFKLNELLKSADIEILMEKGDRVRVNGK